MGDSATGGYIPPSGSAAYDQELEDIFYDDAPMIGKIILDTIRQMPAEGHCECKDLRKETLLKGIYNK